MKLSVYACKLGISYRTAHRWFKAGKVPGFQADTGTIIVTDPIVEAIFTTLPQRVAIYTRVSAAEDKDHLEGQTKRLSDYCDRVVAVVKEIGSGVNDTRPKLLKLLTDPTIALIVVEHKDSLTRFGFNYIEPLLAMQGRQIDAINLAENGKEDLVQDFVSIVTSFCAGLYGQRRSKGKTERILAELQNCEEGRHASETEPGQPRQAAKAGRTGRRTQRVVQANANWLISNENRQPNQSADLPQEAVSTPLSDRWQRCAWQQACGKVPIGRSYRRYVSRPTPTWWSSNHPAL